MADRFHLIKNARETLDAVLKRLGQALAVQQATCSVPVVAAPIADAGDSSAAQQRRQERHAAIHALHAAGESMHGIMRHLDLARNTVRQALRTEHCSPRARTQRLTSCQPFAAWLRERWASGEHNSAQLFREIQAQGYRGSASMVRTYVASWRTVPAQRAPTQRWSVRKQRWVLWKAATERSPEEAAWCDRVREQVPLLAEAATLIVAFQTLIQQRDLPGLASWLRAARSSGIAELLSFAQGIKQDLAAVQTALEVPWSND